MADSLKQISSLVDRFQRNIDAYHSSAYNETQLRIEFIDPFFEALGWDITNNAGYAEQYKDVIHEDAIKIAGATKAPDYCFRIGGARKFFLETKKPSIDIKIQTSPAYQLRRYAWSAKLPISILTDFQEMAIYDCRLRPKPSDKPSVGRVRSYAYTQYLDSFEEIYNLLSKESVLKGSFDKFAESERQKRGTTEVDAEFLKEIESWREDLAKDIAMKNQKLSIRELNYVVQLTIDRIIFLRMCEERGIEKYGQIQNLLNGTNTYRRLREIFYHADDKYNSGLFDFKKDQLTPELKVDDTPLRDIFKNLYYPESPYEFSVLGADILGHVYEQFLGKVIRLTEGHRAKVEEKPEVRKAGGVYYTPTYIVEYIVKNTVGKLCEGKTSRQISSLRILDPACGSGSFLLGAYQYLLDYHLSWYQKDGRQKHTKEIYQGHGGQWYLTIQEKKRILLNNIFGVDIDPQAVEVTKLSLLLKVMEGENQDTLERQMRLFRERALPDLGNNIKCGNSLIGPDFYSVGAGNYLPGLSVGAGHVPPSVNEEEIRRINAFDWQKEFPEIMKRGGFDSVIGNPPYIRIQTMKEWAPSEVEIYKEHYASASRGNYDIYVVFVERGLSLLNKTGRLGFILPHKFFNAQYGQPLRGLLSKGKHLAEVIHFGDQQVFAGASNYTCLLFLDKTGRKQCHFVKVVDLTNWRINGKSAEGKIPATMIGSLEWNFTVGKSAELFYKLKGMPVKLGNIAERIAQGIRTSANEVYVLDLVSASRDLIVAHSKQLDKDVKLERRAVSLFLQGREIKRYQIIPSGKVVIIPYQAKNGPPELITQKEMKEKFAKAFEYLLENKTYLENRERGRMRGSDWYAYIYPKNIEIMHTNKILVPDIAAHASFALDETGEFAFTSGYGITLKSIIAESPKYILGLLNSKVLDFYLKNISTTMRGGFFRYFTQFIEQLPIRRINFSDATDKDRHHRMAKLVEQILRLHKQLAQAKTPDEKSRIQRQIDAIDQEIDFLVYELYGLTEKEIQIIEERT
jgi:type I restriction-modification system DNA methylase subunit